MARPMPRLAPLINTVRGMVLRLTP
jgi:hypothetical protein